MSDLELSIIIPVHNEQDNVVPLMEETDRPWKAAAFSQYPRAKSGSRHTGRGAVMGYAVRTDRYRYVEWQKAESGDVLARELYDAVADPSSPHTP